MFPHMKRAQMNAKIIYHIYNRGAFRNVLFKNKANYNYFIAKINKFKKKYFINVLSYCIMPNHFHLLIYALENGDDIARFMKGLQHSYALHFRKQYDSSGHVFESRYKHKLIKDPWYLSTIISYIKNNPVRKGLVTHASEWPYSM